MALQNPYPERDGNAFTLLPGVEAFLPAMEQAIHDARRYVLVEQYLVSSGEVANRILDALIDCAHRDIEVYMLLDHFGSHPLSIADRQRIIGAGITLIFYNPIYLNRLFRNLPRNHRKMLLIDGERAYTGGVGICDHYLAQEQRLPWHDVIVEMRGPVVSDWQAQFVHCWRHWNGVIDLPETIANPAGKQRGRLTPSLRGLKKHIKKALYYQIRHASERVWLSTAYFLPSRSLLRALRAAKKRGVDVRLLLPGPISDHPTVYHAGRRYYHSLLRHGIRIFEYQPAFMHAKTYLCDDWCSIGSCNMDRWGLRWNLEANLESSDPALCAEIETFFTNSLPDTQEITLEEWLKRPLKYRLGEWLFGYIDLLVDRIGMYRELRKGRKDRETIFNPRP